MGGAHVEAAFQPLDQGNYHLPVHNHSQNVSPAPYSICNPAHRLLNGFDPQIPPGRYAPLPEQHGSGHTSDGSGCPLPNEPIGPNSQQFHNLVQQNCYFQHEPSQFSEGGNPLECAVLQEASELLGRDMNQRNLTSDENPIDIASFLLSDSRYPDISVGSNRFCGEPNLAVGNQCFTSECNAVPKQSDLVYDSQRYYPSRPPYSPPGFFASILGNDQAPVLTGHGQPSDTLSGQRGPTRVHNKQHRYVSIYSDQTSPPQYLLPADPPAYSTVVHKGSDMGDCRSVYVKEGSMVTVDPHSLPPDHPQQQFELEARSDDNMVIHPEQLQAPLSVVPGPPASYVEHTTTASGPVSHRPVNSPDVSLRSRFHDSGSAIMLESMVNDILKDPLSALKLTDTECSTDYEEAENGYVGVNIKGRMRRSYIMAKMYSLVSGLDSSMPSV